MKKFNFYLFLSLAIAFILRIYISESLLYTDISIAYPFSYTDMATYKKLAIEVSRNIMPASNYYQPFYYYVFLANIFRYIGTDIGYIILIQSLLGMLTVLFAALAAKSLWDKKAGFITAILVTFSHVLIFYTPYMLIVTLQAFWLSFILYLSILAYKKYNLAIYFLLGIVTGCSILTRGNIWILIPMFIVLAVYSGINKYLQSANRKPLIILIPMIILMISLMLPQIPFIIQNSIKADSLRAKSNAGVIVFGLGNMPDSPPGGLKYTPIYNAWVSKNNESDFFIKFYNYIKNNKLSYLDKLINKLLLFWDYREIPNNTNINLLTKKNPILKIGFATTPIIIILGLSGLLLFFPFKRKNLIYLLPMLIVFFYWISISLFYILARFRAPLIPVLSVYAGGFLSYVLFTKQKNIFKKWVVTFFLLLISVYITYFLYNIYYLNFEPHISKEIRPYGTAVNINNSLQINDNAPMMYKGWYYFKLQSNDHIIKFFKLEDIKNIKNINSKTGKLVISVFAYTPSILKIMINGTKYRYDLKEGQQNIDLSCPLIFNKKDSTFIFKIKIINMTGLQFFIMDRQRQYNRTIINDKILSAELVAKLIIPNSK